MVFFETASWLLITLAIGNEITTDIKCPLKSWSNLYLVIADEHSAKGVSISSDTSNDESSSEVGGGLEPP
jgi:hypothetical protein